MTQQTRDLRVLNLGAGVQSSTVLLMMKSGEIEPADVAIFADTQWEPKAVYDWLTYLESMSSVPIIKVTNGNIRQDLLAAGEQRWASIPVYVKGDDGTKSGVRRMCTSEYKIVPIEREIRSRLGGNLRGKHVEQVFGISLDEVRRMRDPKAKWQRFVYPLIDLRMTRHDCKLWMERNGYPEPPRSACIGCPYHSNDEWRALTPNEWADATQFDDAFRIVMRNVPERKRLNGEPYLHRSLVRLRDVDLSTEEDRGQLSMWDAECEGMCGV